MRFSRMGRAVITLLVVLGVPSTIEAADALCGHFWCFRGNPENCWHTIHGGNSDIEGYLLGCNGWEQWHDHSNEIWSNWHSGMKIGQAEVYHVECGSHVEC